MSAVFCGPCHFCSGTPTPFLVKQGDRYVDCCVSCFEKWRARREQCRAAHLVAPICYSTVDTITARIVQNQPRPDRKGEP